MSQCPTSVNLVAGFTKQWLRCGWTRSRKLHRLICRGHNDVVDADLSKYFDSARRPAEIGGPSCCGWLRAAIDQAVAVP
jgi:hypothetical protein